jgi:hypothetical protein
VDTGNIKVALEEADVIAAFRLHGRRSWKSWLFYLALSAVAVALGWWILASPQFPSFMNILGAIALGSTGGWWLTTIVFMLLLPYNLRRKIRKSGAGLGTYTLSWDAGHLCFENPDTRSRKAWDALVKWRQNKRVFLVYFSKRFFWIVPKRLFADEAERIAFAALLGDRIGPENRPRPGN